MMDLIKNATGIENKDRKRLSWVGFGQESSIKVDMGIQQAWMEIFLGKNN